VRARTAVARGVVGLEGRRCREKAVPQHGERVVDAVRQRSPLHLPQALVSEAAAAAAAAAVVAA
jgi:hypothetical protein